MPEAVGQPVNHDHSQIFICKFYRFLKETCDALCMPTVFSGRFDPADDDWAFQANLGVLLEP
jgi:hypothetical protein